MANTTIQGFEEKSLPFNRYFCPGRVNLIGEHIDYNGGLVLPAAISLGTTLYIKKRSDGLINIQSQNFDGNFTINPKEENTYNEENSWANYAIGCIELLRQKGIAVGGYELLFESNLPMGAGLSSSASIEVLTLYALLAEEGISTHPKQEIALWAKAVENDFVGMSCGIMDQFAVAMGQAGQAIKLNCETLEYDYIPAQFDRYSLLIISTNKPRKLIHSAYNTRLAECRSALAKVNQNHAFINLCEVPLAIAEAELNDEILLKRARHCITEQQRVITASKALADNNLPLFAQQMVASHLSLRDDYEVTGPELDALFNAAMETEGCIAARMTGAGFGGCAIALVESTKVEAFKNSVAQVYTTQTGLDAQFYACQIGGGVQRVL
jgi:galactokinase